MGWERKRGKLVELSELLSGEPAVVVHARRCRANRCPHVRYVITLDADSLLTRGGARRLIATLAHPLNQAEFDPAHRRAAARLHRAAAARARQAHQRQPHRSSPASSPATRAGPLHPSRLGRLPGSVSARASSSARASWTWRPSGAAWRAASPRTPCSATTCSKGIVGRAGLVTDVVVLEDYPRPVSGLRPSACIAGCAATGSCCPGCSRGCRPRAAARSPMTFPPLDRWKILDNLRRSLLAPALLALLRRRLDLAARPGSGLDGAGHPGARGLRSWPAWRSGFASRRPGRPPCTQWRPPWTDLARWLLSLGLSSLRGTARARRHRHHAGSPAVHPPAAARVDAGGAFCRVPRSACRVGPHLEAHGVCAGAGAGARAAHSRAVKPSCPGVAARSRWPGWPRRRLRMLISRPLRPRPAAAHAGAAQRARHHRPTHLALLRTVRRPRGPLAAAGPLPGVTRGQVAHRTSPTNIGFLLLSALAASDLGYVSLIGLALRLSSTCDTLEALERHRGHFFNWYDTRTLAPLAPRYVSTVDSGNLAACLIAAVAGCSAMPEARVFRWQRWQGLLDTLAVLGEGVQEAGPAAAAVRAELAEIPRRMLAVEAEPDRWADLLSTLSGQELPELDQLLMQMIEVAAAHSHPAGAGRPAAEFGTGSPSPDEHAPRTRSAASHGPISSIIHRRCSAHRAVGPLVQGAWRAMREAFPVTPRLREVPESCRRGEARLQSLRGLLSEPGPRRRDRTRLPSDACARRWNGASSWPRRCSRRAWRPAA